jgi:hypothetical protein
MRRRLEKQPGCSVFDQGRGQSGVAVEYWEVEVLRVRYRVSTLVESCGGVEHAITVVKHE